MKSSKIKSNSAVVFNDTSLLAKSTRQGYGWGFLLRSTLLFMTLSLGLPGLEPGTKVFASDINLQTIAFIESSNNINAVGDNGGALGLYQLHQSVITDYNRAHNTSVSHQDALDSKISYVIANWYLSKRIPSLLKHFKKPVNQKNIIWAYNAGIGSVVKGKMPKTTKNYLIKYEKYSGSVELSSRLKGRHKKPCPTSHERA